MSDENNSGEDGLLASARNLASDDQYAKWMSEPEVTSIPETLLCEPPEGKGIEYRRDESGFKQMVTKTALQPLKLVTDSCFQGLRKGATVYLTAEAIATARWAQAVFEIEGKRVVMVPAAAVVAFKRCE